jgi:LmbE family N-acetylglucosaminyl deacetylase
MEANQSTQPQQILVIAAHADDIEFGMAGTVARWTSEGHTVTYCIITDGSAGSNDPDVQPRELIATRRDEQIAAAAVVGVTDVRFLGYTDGSLQPTIALRRELTRLIRDVKPYRVICQDPTTVFVDTNYINHPDHRAAGEAAIYAVFPSAETRPIFPELLSEGFAPHKVSELWLTLTTTDDQYIDVTDFMDRKIESLLCHRSQVGPEAAEWIKQWNAEAGQKAGCAFAEGFRVMRFVDN